MVLAQQLPFAEDSEIQVLGFLLNYQDIVKVSELEAKHFYKSSHQQIFSAIMKLAQQDIEIDVITVIESFNKEDLSKIGGITYITELANHFVTVANLKHHVARIKDTYNRRELISRYSNIMPDLYDTQKPVVDIVSKVEDVNAKCLQEDTNRKILYSSQELMSATMKNVKKCYDNKGEVVGIKTLYRNLDNATNGLQKGDLVIIGARPSMGKTAFALNIAERVSAHGTVAFFSLEMGAEKIGNRILSLKSFIGSGKVARGVLTESEILNLEKTSTKFAEHNFYLVDESKINMAQIRAKAKVIKNKSGGLDLLIIDHLGLIDSEKRENRTQEVGDITKTCKSLAKELGCAVILLSQLSRAVEQRADKRPMLSDLRESGNIEQDADIVVFLYRDEYYNPETEEKDTLELIIGKNRDGFTGTMKLGCNLRIQSITDLEELR